MAKRLIARGWCFTINNYTEDDILKMEEMPYRYLVTGYEIGEEERTPHIQGYVEFKHTTEMKSISKKWLPRASIRFRRGTRDEAREYCMKGTQNSDEFHKESKEIRAGKRENRGPNFGIEANFLEFGNWKAGGQGTRNDLDAIRQLAVDGGLRLVTRVAKSVQQTTLAAKFLEYNEAPRKFKGEDRPTIIWIWGPTGTRKSHVAHKLAGKDMYRKHDGTKWWNGYDGQETIILDDFRDSWWSITDMLSLTDRYEHRIENKGGVRQMKARTIYITCCKPPEECYKNTGECLEQLKRRITKVYHLETVADALKICPRIRRSLTPQELELVQKDTAASNGKSNDDKVENDNIEDIKDDELNALLASLEVLSDSPKGKTESNELSRNEDGKVIIGGEKSPEDLTVKKDPEESTNIMQFIKSKIQRKKKTQKKTISKTHIPDEKSKSRETKNSRTDWWSKTHTENNDQRIAEKAFKNDIDERWL